MMDAGMSMSHPSHGQQTINGAKVADRGLEVFKSCIHIPYFCITV